MPSHASDLQSLSAGFGCHSPRRFGVLLCCGRGLPLLVDAAAGDCSCRSKNGCSWRYPPAPILGTASSPGANGRLAVLLNLPALIGRWLLSAGFRHLQFRGPD